MRSKFVILAAVVAMTLVTAPAALADKSAPPAPCKDVPSQANHCDQDGQNDLNKHPSSSEHANENSDCNARGCEPTPTPTPTGTATPTPTPTPTVTPTPTGTPTSTPTGTPTSTGTPSDTPDELLDVAVTMLAESGSPTETPSKNPDVVTVPQKAIKIPSSIPAGDGGSQNNPALPAALIALASIAAVGAGYRLIKN